MVSNFLKFFIAAGIILNFALIADIAQGEHPGTSEHPAKSEHPSTPEHPHEAVTQATPKLNPGEVVITGKILSVAKTPELTVNTLLVEKSLDAQAKSIDAAVGRVFEFVPNAHSEALITDESYAGKTVIVVGKINLEENTVEIRFFKVKEG